MRRHWFLVCSLWMLTAGFPAVAVADSPAAEDLLKQGIRLANEAKYDQALEKLRAAVSRKESDASAHVALGMVSLQLKNYDEARKALEKASELDPASPTAHYGLAMLYEKFNEGERARASWKKFIEASNDPKLREMAERHLDRLK
ncbi:MAG: tetratricopeptide repeat protein [Elusimicrobia bacterium]|nr:tetratricopeptide repeat protein [Elusimicrobiota bacterium]